MWYLNWRLLIVGTAGQSVPCAPLSKLSRVPAAVCVSDERHVQPCDDSVLGHHAPVHGVDRRRRDADGVRGLVRDADPRRGWRRRRRKDAARSAATFPIARYPQTPQVPVDGQLLRGLRDAPLQLLLIRRESDDGGRTGVLRRLSRAAPAADGREAILQFW